MNISQIILPFLLSALLFFTNSFAANSNCPEHFVNGKAPDILNPKLSVMAREICYSGYAVMHSGVTRTPIYVAEHLTRERIQRAKNVKRSNNFYAEENLPEEERAELKHYTKSGYDRGHMAPAADMPDEQSMYESFSLTNVVPQNPKNNRGIWSRIESAVRSLAIEREDVYVITGPVFDKNNKTISEVVRVPTKLFKAVFDRHGKLMRGYLVTNDNDASPQYVAIEELEQIALLKFFSLPI